MHVAAANVHDEPPVSLAAHAWIASDLRGKLLSQLTDGRAQRDIALDELGEFLGCALQREPALDRIGAGHAEHFFTDAETEIGSPFDILCRSGKRETKFSKLFDVHNS